MDHITKAPTSLDAAWNAVADRELLDAEVDALIDRHNSKAGSVFMDFHAEKRGFHTISQLIGSGHVKASLAGAFAVANCGFTTGHGDIRPCERVRRTK